MKALAIILLLLLPCALFAQNGSGDSTKSHWSGGIVDMASIGKPQEPLYIVDGKPKSSIKRLKPESISSIEVVKGDSAVALYGKKGVNGVVVITTKDKVRSPHLPDNAQSKQPDTARLAIGILPATRIDKQPDTTRLVIHDAIYTGKSPLYVVDGNIVDDINKIDPNNILSVQILKGDSATAIYGQGAVNGVVIIKTKASLQESKPIGKDTLYMVDGKVVKDLSGIDEHNIISKSYLTGEALKALHGKKVDCLVVVTTKSDSGIGHMLAALATEKDSSMAKNALPPVYILNGEVVKLDDLKKLQPEGILKIAVLKNDRLKNESSHGTTILITTKNFAKAAYQKKFSLLSKKYNQYISKQNGVDYKVTYVLDGVVVGDKIEKLYDLKPEQIRSVNFLLNKNLPFAEDPSTTELVITTKK